MPASTLYSASSADNGHKQLKAHLKIADKLGIPLDLWARHLLGQLSQEEQRKLYDMLKVSNESICA